MPSEEEEPESSDDEYVHMGFVDLILLALARAFCGAERIKILCKRH